MYSAMRKKKTVEQAAAENMREFMKHGPGLRTATNTWVVARDPERRKVLIGGLGGAGVGQMWFDEKEGDKDRTGYDEAPIQNSAPEPMRIIANTLLWVRELWENGRLVKIDSVMEIGVSVAPTVEAAKADHLAHSTTDQSYGYRLVDHGVNDITDWLSSLGMTPPLRHPSING
jgi:hypothetical protein